MELNYFHSHISQSVNEIKTSVNETTTETNKTNHKRFWNYNKFIFNLFKKNPSNLQELQNETVLQDKIIKQCKDNPQLEIENPDLPFLVKAIIELKKSPEEFKKEKVYLKVLFFIEKNRHLMMKRGPGVIRSKW